MKHGVGCLRWNKNKTFLLCLSSDILLSLFLMVYEECDSLFLILKYNFVSFQNLLAGVCIGFFCGKQRESEKGGKKSHWIGKTYSGMIHHQSDKIKKKRREYIIEIVCEWAMIEAYHFILSSNRDDDDDVYLLNGCETMKVVKTYN